MELADLKIKGRDSPPATRPRTTLQGGARHYVERAKSLYSVRFVPKNKNLDTVSGTQRLVGARAPKVQPGRSRRQAAAVVSSFEDLAPCLALLCVVWHERDLFGPSGRLPWL